MSEGSDRVRARRVRPESSRGQLPGPIVQARMDSPLGPLRVTAGEAGLRAIEFLREAPARTSSGQLGRVAAEAWPPVLREAARQLDEYFEGLRTAFDLPLDLRCGTDFERAVWRLLREIPYGATRRYGELARQLGGAGLARAVGGACGRNPLPILVPCHRVVASGGGLGGFSAGLERKRALLELERGLRDGVAEAGRGRQAATL